MRYLLDTDACIYIIKKQPVKVFNRLKKCSIGDVAVSSITVAELEYGAAKSSRPDQNRNALLAFLSPFEILPFDDQAAIHYGDIRSHLEKTGKLIGSMDMLIAAHARSIPLILVSNNTGEFARVPDLHVENWV
ncbi:MAG: VapC toxin family PIN domain ribonuclease [Deltaproteobacteria bacterium HGW-Deltaproteobacteria-6]|jgi:tRNA(fMet)-specific endonuclease VapC|nr:MAG: VapC toxin family PIN domain ribonuclease [Deltaproteobacteria bacterium HGW-Deltaproteobacteria-6]